MATRKTTLKTVNINIFDSLNVTVSDTSENMYATMALNDFLAGRDITANVNGDVYLIPYHFVQVVGVTENTTSTEVTDAFCADGE